MSDEIKTTPGPDEKPAPPKPAPRAPAKPAGPTYNDISGDELIIRLKERFNEAIEESVEFLGQRIIRIPGARASEILRFLRDEEGFDFLSDLTAIHYPDRVPPFEVVYQLYSFPHHARLRVKAGLGDGESIASVVSLWGTADWLEREAWDLFGVRFEGHPALRRILLPADWDGHPLRKEHALEYRENDWVRRHLEIREVHPETDQTGKFELTDFVKANR